jgi:hypothetical protein
LRPERDGFLDSNGIAQRFPYSTPRHPYLESTRTPPKLLQRFRKAQVWSSSLHTGFLFESKRRGLRRTFSGALAFCNFVTPSAHHG